MEMSHNDWARKKNLSAEEIEKQIFKTEDKRIVFQES